jgi:prophage tail gpP-like protein
MTVTLHVQGQRLSGFASGTVQLSMEAAFNSFEVEYVAGGKMPGERVVYCGDPCSVSIDGEVILGGYCDAINDEDAHDRLTLRATGRSKTCDVADCSAVHKHFSGQRVSQIARTLAKEVGVTVRLVGDEGAPFESWHVQTGETIIDAILRACGKRGLYAYCVGEELVLARAGTTETKTKLVRGHNILRWTRADSWEQRFSEYVFRGQVPSTDGAWGSKATQLKHMVKDAGVNRHRPLALQVEAHGPGDVRTRAEVERNQRAVRGESITCRVSGHTTVEGYVWRPNVLVAVKNPVLGVDAKLLVVTARLRFGESEDDDTELTLARPEGFDMVHYPALGRGSTWK